MDLTELTVGARCEFSDLGRLRNPRLADRVGTVVSVMKSSTKVLVLIDGNKNAVTFHRSYLQVLPQ